MSSNIGPEAEAAYQKYLDAATLDEKITRLEEFISLVPKHKATEKIVALNRSKLAKLKREREDKKEWQKSIGKQVSPFSIKKEGIQMILVSDYHVPGTGKTSLLNLLTGAAKDKIGKFTSLPEIGVYEEDNIKFQIVDMPSIMKGASSGIANGKEILSQIRSCDVILICVDLSRNVDQQISLLMNEFTEANIRINVPPPPITVEKTGSNKIQVFYLTKEAKQNKDLLELTERIQEIIYEGGVRNAIVKIFGKITLDQIVDAMNPSVVYKKAVIIGTKGDLPNTEDIFQELKAKYSSKFPLILGSSVIKEELTDFGEIILESDFGEIILKFLDKIKVYTSHKGEVAQKPLIMDTRVKVRDVAIRIHRSFYEKFDYAVIIRKSARQKRKKVGLDYDIKDNDIIEIFTR
jgi:ribosome-interacting GTPase 1